ncbi:MAG: M1 family metallopeptidase, partial [Planctomycetes bacterium]|nr:M1 family metallopeptidase [Planctomycetota bacterium]
MTDRGVRPFSDPSTPRHWIRPKTARITHVDLSVTIDLDACRVDGVVEHRCEFLEQRAGRVLGLDSHDLVIREVSIDGAPASHSSSGDHLLVAIPDGARGGTVRIAFTADHPAKGMYFIPADPRRSQVAMCWTQGAMEDHSHWFPCFDSPNNLSTWRISVRHRDHLTAVANGVRQPKSAAVDGWSTAIFVQDRPHVVYLVNVAVGEFSEVVDSGGPVPIAHYVPRGREAEAGAMFRATGFAISWLSAFIGVPFPWARYGHVVVHRFMWGGMENASLTTITDRVLMDAADQAREDIDCDSLVIHELVHQWYGDLLTMKGWSDIWLNESFATYLEARGTAAWRAHGDPRREADELALLLWIDRRAYLDEDGGRYRRALVTNRYEDAYELFDRVAYEKGCLVLHQLLRLLGEDRFRAALTLYTTRHAHDLVETADFRQALEDATGEPLDWFFDLWVHRAGHPRLRVRWKHDPARGQLVIELEQSQASGLPASEQPEHTYRLAMDVVWAHGSGDPVRRRVEMSRVREVVMFPCPTAPTWVALDPEGDVPAEWDEDADAPQLAARLEDARLAAPGRARAAV